MGLCVCLVLQDILGGRVAVGRDRRVTLLRSSEWNIRLLQGLRPSGYIPACVLTSLRDLRLGYGVVTLLRSSERKRRFITGVETPACILSSLRDYSRTAVLCRDSASLHPCLYCIVPTGLRVWAMDIVSSHCLVSTRHFGRRLGIKNKFVLLSACSKIGL